MDGQRVRAGGRQIRVDGQARRSRQAAGIVIGETIRVIHRQAKQQGINAQKWSPGKIKTSHWGAGTTVSRFMGSRSHPHLVLSVCVCVCVSRCLWVCVIEADSLQLRVITVGLYLFLSRSLLCQILAVFAVDVYGPFWFRDSIPEPCCFLDSDRRTLAAHCFPALPASAYGKLRLCPTESSVSAYGKLRLCLRRAPL